MANMDNVVAEKLDEQVQVIEQKLSVLVRARLLFQREVEIERGGDISVFNQDYVGKVISNKQKIDFQMNKMLASSAGFSLLLYLVGNGLNPEVPLWGLALSAIPGVGIFLSFISAYTLALAAFLFINSQTYTALIDQLILFDSRKGVIDVDMVKAAHESEWLIFKALRSDFSLYAPVHIEFQAVGRIFNKLTLAAMTLIAIMPFIFLIAVVPYLSTTMLEDTFFGIAAKWFTYLCVGTVLLLLVVANMSFKCDVVLTQRSA